MLSTNEIKMLNNFISIMSQIYSLIYDNSKQNFKDYNNFLKIVHDNIKIFPFLKSVKREISDLKNDIAKVSAASNKISKISAQIKIEKNKLENFFKKLNINSNVNSIIPTIQKVESIYRAYQTANQKPFDSHSKDIENIFKKSGLVMAFFGGGKSSNYIDSFEKSDWENLLKQKINSQTTKLPPLKKSDDFTYYVYFIENLSKKNDDDFESDKIIKFYYEDDKEYKNLLKLVDNFQHSNNGKVLKEILIKIKQFPELIKYLNKLKNKTKVVYRGVPKNEDEKLSHEKIIAMEKKKNFVSTSTSESVAERFAKSRGHLEHNDRTDGYIIKYGVDKNSILLDFSIFGSLYYESEIIINPKKAKILDTEFSMSNREDEGWN